MNALVVDRYFGEISAKGREAVGVERRGVVGEGGVILVGDAAHQFPPAGGFGLNTGLQVCPALTLVSDFDRATNKNDTLCSWNGGLSR